MKNLRKGPVFEIREGGFSPSVRSNQQYKSP